MTKNNTQNILKTLVKNPEEEKKAAESIFSNSLLPFFDAEDEINLDILKDYNGILILLLHEDKNFKKILENALYSNQEKITTQEFRINGKQKEPVIANWLKDFIKIHGTGIFNNLEITKYITNSKNCQKLNEKEKKNIKKLLLLYKNVKFFPQSLSAISMNNWQIIPVGNSKIEFISDSKLNTPQTPSEKEINKLGIEKEKYSEGGLEQLAITEEMEDKKKIEDLEIMANKFKDDSIEKKAILEEVEKLKKK